jgi:hypothetical protein
MFKHNGTTFGINTFYSVTYFTHLLSTRFTEQINSIMKMQHITEAGITLIRTEK